MIKKELQVINANCCDNIKSEEELKKLSEMQELAKQQSEKMAALGQLAGGIAHDFNNQLMSIIGNATMIQRTDDLNKVKEYAERIIHISQSTASLTKKILMFSKNESKNNKAMSLRTVMDSTFNMLESIISRKIQLSYKYEATNKMILGDEAQIENLIVNMVLNSKDAVEDSFGKIVVGTTDTVVFCDMPLSHGEILKPGNYIMMYVEDNGVGIPDNVLLRIFEPYFTTKTKTKGTGLGLSVVFGTVKSHSGFINVTSKKGCGTRFEIFLPVYTKEQAVKIKKNIEINSNLIMLVDDDTNVLDIETELLEDLGYDVIKFNQPLKALEYYNTNHKNIAFSVLDICMPEMTGVELYCDMKKTYAETKVIFITGYAMQKDYEELIGNSELIINKPFTYEDLSLQIAKMYQHL